MTSADRKSQLREIAQKGAPGQAAHARDLLSTVTALTGDLPPALAEEIGLLFDAYLHDPYLTRQGSDTRVNCPDVAT